MKTLITILLLALAAPAIAGETDSRAGAVRYVADDIKIVTLPGGEVITRLVSRSGVTAGQYWVDSVYGQQGSMVVFQGNGFANPRATVTQTAQQREQRSSGAERAPKAPGDFVSQASD